MFSYYLMNKDPENGPYKTIQEAINAANPGGVIKISPGLYSDNLVIEYIDDFTK